MALFDRLMRRAHDKARAAADIARRNVEAALAAVPDVQLRFDDDMLVIEAMGLARRWLNDAQLRFAFWKQL